jgi:hypothetical protein
MQSMCRLVECIVAKVNTEETRYMLLSCHQNSWQNRDIKITGRCFENVAQFRYLGMTIRDQKLIQEEVGS